MHESEAIAPWMDEREVALIRGYLQPTHRMLEYGAGGSTLHFAKLVREYVSIEHNSDWFDRIHRLKPENVELHRVPANEPHRRPSTYWQFRDYINFVVQLNRTFDRVLIDGRARPQCAWAILPYLAPAAVVFIHDFLAPDRQHYLQALKWYDKVDEISDTPQTLVMLRPKFAPGWLRLGRSIAGKTRYRSVNTLTRLKSLARKVGILGAPGARRPRGMTNSRQR